ncbi:hypothetical protein L596_023485 [Steinernema carpocapsae]|uniref:Uncharacterized protein n=1 Tax=Steinernema carpocapsae TaxID=34508 RepID=A0A4U5MDS1_STECR|nr:hypothetical protein L596_023485 [Steinernema carpocapsae]
MTYDQIQSTAESQTRQKQKTLLGLLQPSQATNLSISRLCEYSRRRDHFPIMNTAPRGARTRLRTCWRWRRTT